MYLVKVSNTRSIHNIAVVDNCLRRVFAVIIIFL